MAHFGQKSAFSLGSGFRRLLFDLEPPLTGYVGHYSLVADELPPLVGDGVKPDEEVSRRLLTPPLAGCGELSFAMGQGLPEPVPFLSVQTELPDQVDPGGEEPIRIRKSQYPRQGRVGRDHPALQIGLKDPLGGVFENGAILGLGLAEGRVPTLKGVNHFVKGKRKLSDLVVRFHRHRLDGLPLLHGPGRLGESSQRVDEPVQKETGDQRGQKPAPEPHQGGPPNQGDQMVVKRRLVQGDPGETDNFNVR